MDEWLFEDYSSDSRTLIICFTSKVAINKFEWVNLFSSKYNHFKCKMLYVRDIKNSWWQTTYSGIEGHGPKPLAKFLNEKIAELDIDRVITMGLSMGGYGAILFGCLLNVDTVFAFSPQTVLNEARYKKSKLHKKFKGLNIDKPFTDLKNVLSDNDNTKTVYHLFYGDKNLHDPQHAKRISNIENVTVILHPIDSKFHTIVKESMKTKSFRDAMSKLI